MSKSPTQVSKNKEIVSRVVSEGLNGGNFEGISELFAADFRSYGGAGGDLEGLDAMAEWMASVHEAFPDFRATEEFSLAEDDLVATRFTYSGTHEGEFMGVPGTDEHVEITGTTIYRIEDGKLAENWVETDTISLLRQVGAIEAPAN